MRPRHPLVFLIAITSLTLATVNLLLACVEAPSVGRWREYGRFFGGIALPSLPTQASSGVNGQTAGTVGATQATVATAAGSAPPRTPWGDPDLQGTWSNASTVPPARVPALPRTQTSSTGGGPEHWYEARPIIYTAQLPIVDPSGGKVPELTPAAAERAAAIDNIRRRRSEAPQDRSPWDRCITRGVPGSMIPINYNNNYQILQSPGYVVILYEMIHDARIIPIGRPHLTGNIRQWLGDARARWEGTTLLVETTNFTDKTQIIYGDGFHTPRLRLTERFTPVDGDTLQYQFTVDDPGTWTKPWTVAIPLKRERGPHRILEYACHEGNRAMSNILSGARAEERNEAVRR